MQDQQPATARNWRVHHVAQVDSTNRLALEKATTGETGPFWVVAQEQLSGRGRRGRHWHSPPGNLYATLLLTWPEKPHDVDTLPLVASLALHDAAIAATGIAPERLAIKWPNDLLVDGRKVSGILLEATSLAGGGLAIVIGMGVNCQHFPDDAAYMATSFAVAGHPVAPERLFEVLADAMALRLAKWQEPGGFAALREHWIARATGLGEKITARFADGELSGRFVEIDPSGRLVLKDAAGHLHMISAADVFFANRAQFKA